MDTIRRMKQKQKLRKGVLLFKHRLFSIVWIIPFIMRKHANKVLLGPGCARRWPRPPGKNWQTISGETLLKGRVLPLVFVAHLSMFTLLFSLDSEQIKLECRRVKEKWGMEKRWNAMSRKQAQYVFATASLSLSSSSSSTQAKHLLVWIRWLATYSGPGGINTLIHQNQTPPEPLRIRGSSTMSHESHHHHHHQRQQQHHHCHHHLDPNPLLTKGEKHHAQSMHHENHQHHHRHQQHQQPHLFFQNHHQKSLSSSSFWPKPPPDQGGTAPCPIIIIMISIIIITCCFFCFLSRLFESTRS